MSRLHRPEPLGPAIDPSPGRTSWNVSQGPRSVPPAGTPPAKHSGAVTFHFLCGLDDPSFGASSCRPGKLILSIVDFSHRLLLCVVRWPSLQPHRVQCYAAESPLCRVCPPPAPLLAETPSHGPSRASEHRRTSAVDCPVCVAPWSLVLGPWLLVVGHGQAIPTPDSSQVKAGQPSIKVTIPKPTNSST